MSEIETLGQREIELLANGLADGELAEKALRIIEQQAKRIAELEGGAEAMSREIDQRIQVQTERLELVRKQGKRIVDLEAQVLASDTVSKTEYAAMVEQRNTMREELKAARFRIADLDERCAELEGLLKEIREHIEVGKGMSHAGTVNGIRAVLSREGTGT